MNTSEKFFFFHLGKDSMKCLACKNPNNKHYRMAATVNNCKIQPTLFTFQIYSTSIDGWLKLISLKGVFLFHVTYTTICNKITEELFAKTPSVTSH